jgi:predicted RNA-binding Zn-ribbon protein involved in translation (DUF1610 family)
MATLKCGNDLCNYKGYSIDFTIITHNIYIKRDNKIWVCPKCGSNNITVDI